MPLITKLSAVAVATVLAGLAAAAEVPAPSPLKSRERVSSSDGFSFLPPQGSDWLEQFGQNEITYLKRTDPTTVSFYAGTIEGKLRAKLSTKDALVAFVRKKKEDWGTDGRYSDTRSSFQVEDKNDSCVRYDMSAHDHGAKNKMGHEFMVLQAIGRFCLHPQDTAVAVDIYYSIRYVPQFDPKTFIAEGEEFLHGLQFAKAP